MRACDVLMLSCQAFMMNAVHPRLVQLLGCGYMQDMNDPDSTVLFQVLEYMDGGACTILSLAPFLSLCLSHCCFDTTSHHAAA